MRRLLATCLPIVLLWSAVLGAGPAAAKPVDSGHVLLELAPGQATATPGEVMQVALSQTIDKGWHTYWRNPGDSGEPTQIKWTLPAGWSAGNISWPTPQRLPVGPLMNYGYSGSVLLPVAITVPASARPGQTVRIDAEVQLLVCEQVCIPESAKLSLDMPVAAGQAEPHPTWGAPVARTLRALPRSAALDAAFARTGAGVKLAIAGAPLAGAAAADAYFFPFDGTVIDHAKPQVIERGPSGLTLSLTPGYAFQAPKPPRTLAGVLVVDGRSYEIEARPGPAPSGAAGLGPPVSRAGPGGSSGGLGLTIALALAFAGGVVLNLMPCVFPVLSMKAASLAGHAHDARAARAQGLAFTAGVVATFLALAGLLIAAKAAGAAVGWGFQLQSPPVVAGLAVLMLLIALNLSGVFEIGQSLQRVGAGASSQGLAGAALTGVLAVVIASPCTAPFMAAALGYALVQPPAVSLLVFAALALGFAAPFLALSLSPALLARLPRPGAWMDSLRKLLAFPMYAAAAWLAWVLAVQAGTTALALLMAGAVLAGLAAWLFGRWQGGHAEGRRSPLTAAAAALSVVLAAGLAIAGAGTTAPDAADSSETSVALASDTFSPERLAALRAEGRPVFVNFTAAWCVTCQVNERVALSRASVADAFERTGAAYLKADWTRRDAVIARTLAEHGRAGVPLYLVYGRNPAAAPKVLPQLLTDGAVVAALEDAGRPVA